MFSLKKAVCKWKARLAKNQGFEDGDIEELGSHLLESVHLYIKQGLSEEEAFKKGLKDIGEPEQISSELQKTRVPQVGKSSIHMLLPGYVKTGYRYFIKKKAHALINISGLAIAMAGAFLIMQYVHTERTYDDFHTNAEQVYRLNLHRYQNNALAWSSATSFPAIGKEMKERFPEVVDYTRLYPASGVLSNEENDSFREEDGFYADESTFEILEITLARGDESSSLMQPNSVVISESIATKYFGEDDAVGKTLRLNQQVELSVTGVFNDYPRKSHLNIDFLISYATLVQQRGETAETSWGWYSFYTYLLLDEGTDIGGLEAKLVPMLVDYKSAYYEESNTREELTLQPLKDIYLYSRLNEEKGNLGNGYVLKYLVLIAGVLMLLAWINYLNISTAKSMERAGEIGVRKASGAHKNQLIAQFLTEAFLINILSLVVAAGIVYLASPLMSTLTGNIQEYSLFGVDLFWFYTISGLLFGTLLSGFYPALILSSIKPAVVLKGNMTQSVKGIKLRRVLVVAQFSASMILIMMTITIYQQLEFMRGYDTGVDLNQTLVVRGPMTHNYEILNASRLETLREQINNISGVNNVVTSSYVPGMEIEWTNSMKRMDTRNATRSTMHISGIDYGFMESYDIQLLSGRNFSEAHTTDSEAILLNKTAAAVFGFSEPEEALGKMLNTSSDTFQVVGVFEDYQQKGLASELNPIVFLLRPEDARYFSIKTSRINEKLIADIREAYVSLFPESPYEYFFLDESYYELYQKETQTSYLLSAFSTLAILIACLGLFGLIAIVAHNKTKEIGIRKVFGARGTNLLVIVTKEFWLLLLASVAISVPSAYLIANAWVQNYAARIQIDYQVFLPGVFLVVLIAVLTLSYEAFKVVRSNPIQSLRDH